MWHRACTHQPPVLTGGKMMPCSQRRRRAATRRGCGAGGGWWWLAGGSAVVVVLLLVVASFRTAYTALERRTHPPMGNQSRSARTVARVHNAGRGGKARMRGGWRQRTGGPGWLTATASCGCPARLWCGGWLVVVGWWFGGGAGGGLAQDRPHSGGTKNPPTHGQPIERCAHGGSGTQCRAGWEGEDEGGMAA